MDPPVPDLAALDFKLKFKAGDAEAHIAFQHFFHKRAYCYARGHRLSFHDAIDVVADSFATLYKDCVDKRCRYDPDRRTAVQTFFVRFYLLPRILDPKHDRIRCIANSFDFSFTDGRPPSTYDPAEIDAAQRTLRAKLTPHLTHEELKILDIVWNSAEEEIVPKIARDCHCNAGAARQRLHRFRERVRIILDMPKRRPA